MKKIATYVLAGTACVLAHAQPDSTLLQEATVVDSRYNAMRKLQYVYAQDSLEKLATPFFTADYMLQQESSVHIRQSAPGQVASSSTRGATSAQTTVLWSGFTLNSAGTGVVDLSLVPTDLFRTSMLRGGNSATFGSGAIGSVFNLKNEALEASGWHAQFAQQLASFSTFRTNVKLIYGNAKFQSVTGFYHDQSENNFPYKNIWVLEPREDKREHAQYRQSHITQLLKFRMAQNQRLEVEGWMNWASRNTPNNVLAAPGTAELTDRYLRSRIGYYITNRKTKLDLQYAFTNEWQTFEDPSIVESPTTHLLDTNIAASHILQANHAWQFSTNLSWQNGLIYRFDDVSGSNRNANQNSASLQSGLYWQSTLLSAQAILRAEVWNGELLPLSPFVGVRYALTSTIYATVNAGYVYRLPTLNDRFWVQGGNPNLKAEHGWTGEAALGYDEQRDAFHVSLRAAGYYSRLQDYIQWLPDGAIWLPQNVKVVEITGIDLNASVLYQMGKWHVQAKGAYSLNYAITRASGRKNDESVGEQINYQPRHKATGRAQFGNRTWFIQTTYRYVGEVGTPHQTRPLPAYHLLDASLGKTFWIKSVQSTISAGVNNMTNAAYQNISYFPMPGTNYSLTLKLSFK